MVSRPEPKPAPGATPAFAMQSGSRGEQLLQHAISARIFPEGNLVAAGIISVEEGLTSGITRLLPAKKIARGMADFAMLREPSSSRLL
jgi:hypothetical protein